jgi:hypothetical protein
MAAHGEKSSDVLELLIRYRHHLTPGLYFFAGVFIDGVLVSIQEVVEPFLNPKDSKYGVISNFYDNGFPDLSLDLSVSELSTRYPLVSDVTHTSPIFQAALLKHLKERCNLPVPLLATI